MSLLLDSNVVIPVLISICLPLFLAPFSPLTSPLSFTTSLLLFGEIVEGKRKKKKKPSSLKHTYFIIIQAKFRWNKLRKIRKPLLRKWEAMCDFFFLPVISTWLLAPPFYSVFKIIVVKTCSQKYRFSFYHHNMDLTMWRCNLYFKIHIKFQSSPQSYVSQLFSIWPHTDPHCLKQTWCMEIIILLNSKVILSFTRIFTKMFLRNC